MKMFLSPMAIRPKGKAKDVFDSLMDIKKDKPKKSKKQKKNKPWKKKKEY